MKFSLKDFIELDTTALLAVNGGSDCSSASSSYYGTSSTSSNGQGSSVTSSEYESYKSNYGGLSGTSSCGSVSTNVITKDGGTVIKPSTTKSEEETPTVGGYCSSIKNDNGTINIEDTKSILSTDEGYEKVMQAVKDKELLYGSTDGKIPGVYIKGSYQCDEYVNEMLVNAGYDATKYFVENPSGKNIDTHINDLLNSSNEYTTNASYLTEGSYVVFMQDADKKIDSHAALLFVNNNGIACMYDNSSRNCSDDCGGYYGGIEKTGKSYSTALSVCAEYSDYENFYFQRVK